MFEGKILHDQFTETGDGLVLREIAWVDLVARLAASRDLRGELEQIESALGGGFDQFANLACSAQDKGKRVVNRNALGPSKDDGAKEQETAMNAANRD